jgi:hypothetical protein
VLRGCWCHLSLSQCGRMCSSGEKKKKNKTFHRRRVKVKWLLVDYATRWIQAKMPPQHRKYRSEAQLFFFFFLYYYTRRIVLRRGGETIKREPQRRRRRLPPTTVMDVPDQFCMWLNCYSRIFF